VWLREEEEEAEDRVTVSQRGTGRKKKMRMRLSSLSSRVLKPPYHPTSRALARGASRPHTAVTPGGPARSAGRAAREPGRETGREVSAPPPPPPRIGSFVWLRGPRRAGGQRYLNLGRGAATSAWATLYLFPQRGAPLPPRVGLGGGCRLSTTGWWRGARGPGVSLLVPARRRAGDDLITVSLPQRAAPCAAFVSVRQSP
jgi:hypothetical protein